SSTGTAAVRCIWTNADDEIMVHVLRQQKDAGNQSGAGWKKQVWTIVAAALEKEGVRKGAEKTASKCIIGLMYVVNLLLSHCVLKLHLTLQLKKNFNEVSLIRNTSGFGWDDATKKCTATDNHSSNKEAQAHKKLE
ncbi:hypothetical protein H0H92_009809, partial [Tricholoma furcatifolium]